MTWSLARFFSVECQSLKFSKKLRKLLKLVNSDPSTHQECSNAEIESTWLQNFIHFWRWFARKKIEEKKMVHFCQQNVQSLALISMVDNFLTDHVNYFFSCWVTSSLYSDILILRFWWTTMPKPTNLHMSMTSS